MYICIDLKSFYASVECVERGLDPMTTNLVVADPERTDKTICLAITPAMKKMGVKNRCRVFEIPKSIDFIIAPPRMQKYIDYSTEVYKIYCSFISQEDIHVYSIDEAFMDVTHYMKLYGKTAPEIGKMIMDTIYERFGLRATCGVGTNLYLTKIALDIMAKHAPNFIGVLDEESYREKLWDHKPLTDFWRIGRGTARRLERYGIYTMRAIAEADEDLLHRVFGMDAELLIDHAWGIEPVTMADIKAYRPKTNCLSSGQVLMCDYDFQKGKIIIAEMMEQLCLDMVEKGLVAESVTLHIGYSNKLNMPSAHGSTSFPEPTNAGSLALPAVLRLYEDIVMPDVPIRRVQMTCNRVTKDENLQLSLFSDTVDVSQSKDLQNATLAIKKKFGKNAMFKGRDLEDGATALERNKQIGGHKSGE